MKNWKILEARKIIAKNPHYKVEFAGGPTSRAKKKIDYEYYICDFCGEQIKITNNRDKREGGITIIPITSYKNLTLALHNSCLKPCIKEINEIYGTNF